MKTLADLTNRTLLILGEPGANAGGNPAIPAGATFSQLAITDALNDGTAAFIDETGYAPEISDKYIVTNIVAGQDYTLPADLAGLVRVEYRAGPVGPAPIPLPQYSFPQFDIETGGAYQSTGAPQMYREPFGGVIRLWPYPIAANVAAGDQIYLYYETYGTVLANLTDVCSLPPGYIEAPVCYALSRFFPRKQAFDAAALWERRFLRLCNRAKTKGWNENQAADWQITDAEMPNAGTLYAD